MSQTKNKVRGQAGELAARDFLLQNGYTLVTMNYRCTDGEIDLIVQNASVLVFVEVKTRRAGGMIRGAAAVNQAKQNRICKTAVQFLRANPDASRHIRFDVVEALTDACGQVIQLRHTEDAFAFAAENGLFWV